MPNVTIRSSAKASSSSANNITVNEPSGAAIGDFIVVVVMCNGEETIADNNSPDAFTKDWQFQNTFSGATGAVFSRVKQSGDPSTYNFTSTATGRISAVSFACQDPAGTPYDVVPDLTTDDRSTSNVTTFDSVDITTNDDNALHIVVMLGDRNTSGLFDGFPSGYTEIETETGTGQAIAVRYLAIATAGATGAQTFTMDPGSAMISQSFAIRSDATTAASITAAQTEASEIQSNSIQVLVGLTPTQTEVDESQAVSLEVLIELSMTQTEFDEVNSVLVEVVAQILGVQTESVEVQVVTVNVMGQEQEGFQYINDDGSESAATVKAAQDINITEAVGVTVRIRVLLNNSGDFGSQLVQLEDSEDTVDDWRKIN